MTVDYRGEELRVEVVDDGRGGAVKVGEIGGAVEVVDDGRGGAVKVGEVGEETGYGISGMRERVALLNGHFSAGPRPEGGFRVGARLPVPAVEPAAL
ncbi:hypothetical protein ACQPYK_42135 [Streptosporangium sp. CA-135522]|uniref:hypothetical protein n=1 Tax=Streptosporangium sp. CA-135522 TaxID=3240072 RepID=UPI003D9278C8